MLTPLESNFGRGDAGVATVDPDYLQYQGSHCSQCGRVVCDTCYPVRPGKEQVCACGGPLFACFAKDALSYHAIRILYDLVKASFLSE
jgi:hypothetical protein